MRDYGCAAVRLSGSKAQQAVGDRSGRLPFRIMLRATSAPRPVTLPAVRTKRASSREHLGNFVPAGLSPGRRCRCWTLVSVRNGG